MTALRDTTPQAPTALLIGDEEPVRCLVHKMLEPEIGRVLEAADAETGLRLIERDDPHIDVVVTDLLMAGLDGLDVLGALHQHRPDLPVLLTSAFAGSIYPVISRGQHLRILQKPFTADAIRDAVALLVKHARTMRQKTLKLRAWAAEVRVTSAHIRERNAAVQRKLDLVAAAWAIHRQRDAERSSRHAPAWS